MSPTPARECRMVWKGTQSEALLDTTRELDIEGALRASKTTICLWKVLNALLGASRHPLSDRALLRPGDALPAGTGLAGHL